MDKIFKITSAFVLVVAASGFMALVPQAESVSAATGCTRQGTALVSAANGWTSYQPYYQTLRYGARSECVRSLQRMINVFCTPDTDLAVDAVYGTKTYRAVKSIQHVLGIDNWTAKARVDGSRVTVDGIAGKQTWAILQAFSYIGGATGGGNIDCTWLR